MHLHSIAVRWFTLTCTTESWRVLLGSYPRSQSYFFLWGRRNWATKHFSTSPFTSLATGVRRDRGIGGYKRVSFVLALEKTCRCPCFSPGGGGGGALRLIFAGYVLLASHNAYPFIVYSVANYRPYLSHFWANMSFSRSQVSHFLFMYLPYSE